jgi:hypothetical protein
VSERSERTEVTVVRIPPCPFTPFSRSRPRRTLTRSLRSSPAGPACRLQAGPSVPPCSRESNCARCLRTNVSSSGTRGIRSRERERPWFESRRAPSAFSRIATSSTPPPTPTSPPFVNAPQAKHHQPRLLGRQTLKPPRSPSKTAPSSTSPSARWNSTASTSRPAPTRFSSRLPDLQWSGPLNVTLDVDE